MGSGVGTQLSSLGVHDPGPVRLIFKKNWLAKYGGAPFSTALKKQRSHDAMSFKPALAHSETIYTSI